MEKEIWARAESKCELCNGINGLQLFSVSHAPHGISNTNCLLCETCRDQIENPENIELNHWRCLNESMWSQVQAVQVIVWRMLNQIAEEGWPQDLLDSLLIDDETLAWAKAEEEFRALQRANQHVDGFGTLLQKGDTVVLIKSLEVKGSTQTAKRGTAVRNIFLVDGNPEQIEGRVNGQQIIIFSKFVRKVK